MIFLVSMAMYARSENRDRKRPAESKTAQTVVSEALDELGILHLKDRSILSLSGGERKMVFIARAIAQGAETLILDEPTNHLDICHQLFLMEYLRQCKRTVLIVLHDLRLASHYCQKVCLMKDGRILEAGDPLNVLNSARTREVFGIEGEAHMTANGERDFRLFDGSAPLIRC